MLATADCAECLERLYAYNLASQPVEERASVERHLATCAECRSALARLREVRGLLTAVSHAGMISAAFKAKTAQRLRGVESREEEPAAVDAGASAKPSGALLRLGAAPWWAVSVCLHVLAILLASLVTMTMGTLDDRAEVIVVTNIEKRLEAKPDDEQKEKPTLRDILESKVDVQATDPASTEQSNIVVPPDILAKAELSDHFETINPDRPDTQSAFGNPDARMFHSVAGNDEPEGGGGSGGDSLMDSLIGVGGSASPGTGGGWGGGNGTGTGVGTGSGHGSFGSRTGGGRRLMVLKHGGSKQTESTVDKALAWLARHQEPDGRWSVKNTDGLGVHNQWYDQIHWDPSVTGLALMAFLGAGHSEKAGKYKDNVRRAVYWLISQQREDGAIGTDTKWKHPFGAGYAYHHAICGMALAEAAGMSKEHETKQAAQKAIDFTCNIYQGGEGSEKLSWRYDIKAGDSDVSVTGWFLMQLKSAKMAGLKFDHRSFDGGLRFLKTCEVDPANVEKMNDGYDTGRHRYGYVNNKTVSYNTTAIGALCQLFCGAKAEEVRGSAEWLLKTNPPEWRADLGTGWGGGWPMYYSYYTTMLMFQVGDEPWKKWNEALKKMLVENQRKDGDFDGSWDPLSGWEKNVGRAYTTALGAMCLEVYYRYLPLYR